MEYLYVCHFSNGHIKIGRSINPTARIASHTDRVACVGIELIEHRFFECVGYSGAAESRLIAYCAERATKRNKSEWFDGLDFEDVCEWAAEFAASEVAVRSISIVKTIRERLGFTQAALGEGMGCTQGNVSFYEKGQTIPPDAARRLIDYAATLGHTITFNDIYGTEGSAQAKAEPVDPTLEAQMAEAAKAGLIERRSVVRKVLKAAGPGA